MIFLLDTTALSELIRDSPATDRLIGNLGDSRAVVVTCVFVAGEIEFGIERLPSGRRRDDLRVRYSGRRAVIPCVEITPPAAEHYVQLKIQQRKLGLALDENDLWNAATAKAMQATMVTNDSDFDRIQGLPVMRWPSELRLAWT